MDMKQVVLLDVPTVGQITTPVWNVISSNFAGIAIVVGFMLGLAILANLIKGALSGKVIIDGESYRKLEGGGVARDESREEAWARMERLNPR